MPKGPIARVMDCIMGRKRWTTLREELEAAAREIAPMSIASRQGALLSTLMPGHGLRYGPTPIRIWLCSRHQVHEVVLRQRTGEADQSDDIIGVSRKVDSGVGNTRSDGEV